MYTIMARFIKNGSGAMNVTAESLVAAQAKAAYIKSQGFYVEIKNGEGSTVPLDAEE